MATNKSYVSMDTHGFLGVGYNVMDSTRRAASIQPEAAVYSGPSETSGKRVTLRTLQTKFRKQEPISMVTAYDYPSAVHVGYNSLLIRSNVFFTLSGSTVQTIRNIGCRTLLE